MVTESSRFYKALVGDVMNRKVVSVSANDLMSEAAGRIVEYSISGVPVVDDAGRCVGVLSASDFTRRERERDSQGHLPSNNVQEVLVQDFPGGAYHVEEVIEDRVANHMTAAVQTISPESTLLQAARCMCLEHVHRLIVVDGSNRPIGVLSTLDVLAAFIATMDYQE